MTDIIETDKKENVQQELQQTKSKFVKCENCGSVRFQQLFVIKEESPFDNPQLDKKAFVPIPIFECMKCKKVFNVFQ